MAYAGIACQAFTQVFYIWIGFTGSLYRKAFSFLICEKLCWMEIIPASKRGEGGTKYHRGGFGANPRKTECHIQITLRQPIVK